MICRLCLCESKDILNIYTETGEMAQKEILKVVAKHFAIEIRYDDTVSNIICSLCWGHLHEFHIFWLRIEEKQKNLESHLQLPEIKRDIEEIEGETIVYNEMPISHEKVDTELCEPEIDIFDGGEPGICGGQTEFVAAKTEEDESTMDDDYFTVPLTDSLDLLSKDIETETEKIDSQVEQKSTHTKAKENRTFEIGKSKRGRPKKSEIAKKKNHNGIEEKDNPKKKNRRGGEAKKPMRSSNYKEKLKAIQEADEFLAQNTELSCYICKEKLKDFKELKSHFRRQHQCPGYAVCCNQRFLKRTFFVDHIQLHKNPDFFKCAICNKQLISRKNYINHMLSLHQAEENLQFGCKQCPKKFSKQYILDSHIRMRHMPKDHICKLCNKAFANTWILTQHEKTVHLNEFESVCDICGKRLRNAANLKYHMDNVHNTEPRPEVQCPVCLKWLKSDRNLRKHMISHRDEASGEVFKCPHCDAEKTTRRILSSHIRYHHSNRVFPCPMCAKEFKTSIGLKEHEATHTGIDLYTCPFCPKTFRSHANMHKHKIHSHSDEWVRKYAQPNEYTLSVLNKTHNIEAQPGIPTNLND
ncbi:transcription factor grauzone-like [Rhagoletis pomonella]|uniref:transcription factor grauzone-like n=1 Tax=Rhagoletis pomonella TaxID=28610 RepID=UPI00178256AC|nr:transcription factor grauzone-like [Rhagoletis pomonella]